MARGQESQHDPARRVDRESDSFSVAAAMHYQQGLSAADVNNMPTEQFNQLGARQPGALTGSEPDQNETYHLLRAYEHYQTVPGESVPGLGNKQ